MPALVHLASRLPHEQLAVYAALTLLCSTGQVEGQIMTLNLLKRQSYERTTVD
jgi:transposase